MNTWLETRASFSNLSSNYESSYLSVPIAGLDFLTVCVGLTVAILVFLRIGRSFDLKSMKDKEVRPRGNRQLVSDQREADILQTVGCHRRVVSVCK